MNGTNKFHKATGPAFNVGEKWLASSGSGSSVTITGVRPYSEDAKHISDYEVTYTWMEKGEVRTHSKDAWNFQVRYHHQADANLKVTAKPKQGSKHG